jgi:hypothetical protein
MRLVLVLMAAAALAPAAIALPAAAPSVVVTAKSPFTVRGAHFKPNERVRIVAWGDGTASRTVTAGPGGGFVTRFPALALGQPCGAYSVRATGNHGSRAALKVTPECAQPFSP